eukprot:TRINITY_DN44880_c0_g1_i1.p1 TRINITY_DN44880_c0_g1~~TRINITY_DN44880_c0_g1_i1.p1  ORF type:complete len:316 (+),score=103.85 TRINITY_DN44880_c0_g1_i1:77-949(+)
MSYGSYQGQSLTALAGTNKVIVKQKVAMLEAICPMCEMANEYESFDADTGAALIYAKEDSHFCCRCCCNPNHTLKLDMSGFSGGGQYGKATPGGQDLTMYRPFRCHGALPAWGSCCQQEMQLYSGAFEEVDEVEGSDRLMGSAKEPCCGGMFRPKINVMDRSGTDMAEITGPGCCFGGATEMCCDQTFSYDFGGRTYEIVRERPETLTDGMKSLFTDSDTFSLQLPSEMTPDQKATMLASLFLMDYMYFENDRWWTCDDGKCKVTCCFAYCCGATLPVKCALCGGDKKDE